VLATNVAAIKFDFTMPASENGYCGYSEITLFGTAFSDAPTTLSASMIAGTGVVLNVGGFAIGQSYTLQSTTNLMTNAWVAETNFVATQLSATFTNLTTGDGQKFYRIVGN
jgi:hypothetical protein